MHVSCQSRFNHERSPSAFHHHDSTLALWSSIRPRRPVGGINRRCSTRAATENQSVQCVVCGDRRFERLGWMLGRQTILFSARYFQATSAVVRASTTLRSVSDQRTQETKGQSKSTGVLSRCPLGSPTLTAFCHACWSRVRSSMTADLVGPVYPLIGVWHTKKRQRAPRSARCAPSRSCFEICTIDLVVAGCHRRSE